MIFLTDSYISLHVFEVLFFILKKKVTLGILTLQRNRVQQYNDFENM